MKKPSAFPPASATERPQATLTIIIVNYESWFDSLRLTESLAAESEFRAGLCQIVVVDNASRGPVPEPFMVPYPGLQIVARAHNDGFAAGVNAGWRAARSPWLLILNPDVEVASGFLSQVFARLSVHEANHQRPPGIVGFGLRNPDGSPQGSVGVFPSLTRTIWEQFIPRTRRKYQAGWRIPAGRVDWVTGACMLVNTGMIDELTGMDEDFFLYYEEVAFSRTAQLLGWAVEYDPAVTVIHRHPLQNRPISPKMRLITRHSKLLYFLKHLPRWQFHGLSWIVALEAATREVWAQFLGRPEDACVWRAIGDVVRQFRDGSEPRGRDVLAFAESVVNPRKRIASARRSRTPSARTPRSGRMGR